MRSDVDPVGPAMVISYSAHTCTACPLALAPTEEMVQPFNITVAQGLEPLSKPKHTRSPAWT